MHQPGHSPVARCPATITQRRKRRLTRPVENSLPVQDGRTAAEVWQPTRHRGALIHHKFTFRASHRILDAVPAEYNIVVSKPSSSPRPSLSGPCQGRRAVRDPISYAHGVPSRAAERLRFALCSLPCEQPSALPPGFATPSVIGAIWGLVGVVGLQLVGKIGLENSWYCVVVSDRPGDSPPPAVLLPHIELKVRDSSTIY